jgi:hypothetical protein
VVWSQALAQQAQAFVAALGVGHRVRILEMDATNSRAARTISSAFESAGRESFVSFEPSLTVSETHCPLMLKESDDLYPRSLHRSFPRAALVPEGVELVGGCFEPDLLITGMAQTPKFSLARQDAIATVLKGQP